MTALNLSVDELLSTTRAVRKRLDFEKTVEIDVLENVCNWLFRHLMDLIHKTGIFL